MVGRAGKFMILILSCLFGCGLQPNGRRAAIRQNNPASDLKPSSSASASAKPKVCNPPEINSADHWAEARKILTSYCGTCHRPEICSGDISFAADDSNEDFSLKLPKSLDAIETLRMPPAGYPTPQPCELSLLKALKPIEKACETKNANNLTFANTVQPVLDQYCIGCHNSQLRSGGVDYSGAIDDNKKPNLVRSMWSALESQRMPPSGPRPNECEREAIKSLVDGLEPRPNTCLANGDEPIDFDKHVAPIANTYCVSCHGEQPMAHLRYDRRDDPDDFRTVLDRWTKALNAVKRGSMPKGGATLSQCEVETIEKWLSTLDDERSLDCSLGATVVPHRMNRLSKIEYANIMVDLFGIKAVRSIGLFSAELSDNSNDIYLGKTVSTSIDAVLMFKAVAEGIRKYFEDDRDELERLVGCSDLDSDLCITKFIKEFGLKTYRRPFQAEEVKKTSDLFFDGSARDGYLDVIEAFLQAPEFFYKMENAATKTTSSFELASRLSFAIWKTTPDEELLNLAQKHDLANIPYLKLLTDEMFNDPRAMRSLQLFFDNLFEIRSGSSLTQPDFFLGDLDRRTLRLDSYNEYRAFLEYVLFSGGTVKTLLTSNVGLITSSNMAQIYGTNPSDRYQILPGSHATGILGRAAFLMQPEMVESPVQRGRKIRGGIVCDDEFAPASMVVQENKDLQRLDFHRDKRFPAAQSSFHDEEMSTRARWESITHGPVCIDCHRKMNPFGFALEEYDSLGRHRELERLYSKTGEIKAEFPLRLQVVPEVIEGELQSVDGAKSLSHYLADHKLVQECLSRKVFRFIFEQKNRKADRCIIEKTALGEAKGEKPILEIFKDFFVRESYLQK